jgi:phosphoenolpyruvate synthase/pyruvate phosphate dikinase
MSLIVHFQEIKENSAAITGGKFFALARMANEGYNIPKGICISTNVYDRFVTETGLRESILMELNRKEFDQMRWEEMWDAALRIRNRFLHAPMPRALERVVENNIHAQFAQRPVTVRSSAP